MHYHYLLLFGTFTATQNKFIIIFEIFENCTLGRDEKKQSGILYEFNTLFFSSLRCNLNANMFLFKNAT